MRLNQNYELPAYRQWKNWDSLNFGAFSSDEGLYFATELARSRIDLKSKHDVLEIGFGNGPFAGWVATQGWSYVGIETDPELVHKAKLAGFEAHSAESDIRRIANGRGFDVIVAIDVIEHNSLDSIGDLLTRLRGVITSNGRFLARLPSGDSPFSRAIQYGDITHQSVIGSGMIKQIAAQTGWSVDIRPEALPVVGLGPVRAVRRIFVLMLRAFVSWIVRVGFQDNSRSIISKNMVVTFKPAEQSATH